MNRKYIDLFFINLLVLLCAFLTLTNNQSLWIRGPVGIIAILAVPGYILSDILFPRPSVKGFERLAIVVGLSVSFAAVGGLLIYLVFHTLNPRTWVIFLEAMTVLGSGLIFSQRRRNRESDRTTEQVEGREDQPLARDKPLPLLVGWLPFALALAIVIGSIFYAQSIARVYPKTEVVQMWLIPDQSNPTQAVQIGVNTSDAIPHTYSIVLKRGNYQIETWSNVVLQSNDHWQMTVLLPAPLPGTGPLEAELINPDSPAKLIRQVTLWPTSQ